MRCVFKAEFQEIAVNFHIFRVMEPETSNIYVDSNRRMKFSGILVLHFKYNWKL